MEAEPAGGGGAAERLVAAAVLPGQRDVRRGGGEVVQGDRERELGGEEDQHPRHQVRCFFSVWFETF